MYLSTWIKKNKKTVSEVALAAGKPYETIRRHILGSRVPKKEMMDFYLHLSKGEVTPNDFYSLTQLKQKSKR